MSTIEDFENAPIGATATSPDGRKVYRREKKTLVGADWVRGEGDAYTRIWADADGLANFGYTLGPAPSPAPTTAREALDLVWNLAHPIKEGQAIPKGTRVIIRKGDGFTVGKNDHFDVTANDWDVKNRRTLEPIPEPEPELPDWLDAPAVLAHCDYCSDEGYGPQITLHRILDGQKWECAECQTATDWSNLREVTPLYPKGKKA